MLAMLERLVNMDTFTSDAEDTNRCGREITGWLAEVGFHVAEVPKPPIPEDEPWQNVLGNAFVACGHAFSQEPGIGLIGHIDTVFPSGTAKARPFKIVGDRATGPGVADMKAGIVTNMFAAKALKQLGSLDCPTTLVFTSDEELGSPTGSNALRKYLTGARAVICSETGGLGGKVTFSRKGSGHMLLKIQGKSAHAGRDYEKGASAIVELAHKILAFDKLLALDRGLTVNTGLVSGGTSANSVAPWAEARIHLTFRALDEGKRVVAAIREETAKSIVPGVSSSVSGGLRLYPFERAPKGDELLSLVVEAGKTLGLNITGQHVDSAAESGFCSSELGVPTICCMGPEGDNIHSSDEYLIPSTILPRCKLIALTALQAAKHFAPA